MPAASIPTDKFSARWTKTQDFTAGTYRFGTVTDDGVRLWVDGRLVIDEWHGNGSTPYSADVALTAGAHTIRMEYFEDMGGAVAKLNWTQVSGGGNPPPPPPPPPGDGYAAQYWNTPGATTAPAIPTTAPTFTRIEPAIDHVWDGGSPDPSIANDHFVARWTKTHDFAGGNYTFTATADDGVRVYVDGQPVIDQWIDQPMTTYTATVPLTAGSHTLRIEYYENGGGAVAKFGIAPGGDTNPPPPPPPPPADGFAGSYWNTPGAGTAPTMPTTAPTLTRTDPKIDFVWDGGSPDPKITPDHFVARWTKTEAFEAGTYKFTTASDDGVRLWVGGKLLIDQWNDHPFTTHTATTDLTAGNHDIRLEYYENGGGAVAKFGYEKTTSAPPPPPSGFLAHYFDNMTLAGTPKLTRTDAAINFVWDSASPDPALPADKFSVRWTKTQDFAAGTYNFTLKSDDGIRFWIDDKLIVDDWTDHAMKTYNPAAILTSGSHTLTIEYYENGGGAVAIFEQK